MRRVRLVAVVLVGGLALGGAAYLAAGRSPASPAEASPSAAPTTPTTATVRPSTTTTGAEGGVPAASVGARWGETPGLTMFRGNPTRTWYGTGPLPESAPAVAWTYPDSPMCGISVVGGESKRWCGTGWTGQPAVWERPDGVTEVVFGAYDKAVHFVDADTGVDTRAPFPVGDIIKGSVTVDPDGFPLLYTGSRDGRMRVLALDREPVEELWALEASSVVGMWNDDWDGNPVVVDDVLYEGGENSWFFAVRLHRGYGTDGRVTVAPEVVLQMPGWTDGLVAAVGRNVSIESSVAVFGRRAYFANSGGRVVGVDMDRVLAGEDPVVFDYWMGDDTDATVVVDAAGMLYVAAELERGTARSEEVGQLVKLDPNADGDPRLWGIAVPGVGGDGGLWATPALGDGHLYAATHSGRLLAVDTATGEITWEEPVGFHAWSSPVVVDDVLLVATCDAAELRAWSLVDPAHPEALWTMPAAAGGCIESTPAVWEGRIYVGSRDGYVRAYVGS